MAVDRGLRPAGLGRRSSTRYSEACGPYAPRGRRFFDFIIISSDDWQSKPKRCIQFGMDKVYAAAATGVVIAETIFRQMQILGRTTGILRPPVLRHIVAGNR